MINLRQQRGAALFMAIFLIVVIALMAATAALTSTTQHTGQARAAGADGAWYAAIARLESEIPGILDSGSCSAGGAQMLFGYSTTLSCQAFAVSEGDENYQVFSLSATAWRGSSSSATLVRRTARAQVSEL